MFIDIILFFVGFYFLIKGAGLVTDGASFLADKLKISPWVIGLLIVGVGTSIPEFSITLVANLLGNKEVALGTIVGSNTFNILFILGASALLYPLNFRESWIRRDLVWNLLAVLAAAFLGFYSLTGRKDWVINRFEGWFLLILFFFWVYLSLKKKPDDLGDAPKFNKSFTLPVVFLMILAGFLGVLLGGKWVVDGAVAVARDLRISEKVIGLTIVGIGTSFNELVVSLVAAYKKQFSLAIGNIVGSNIFDFLLILGLGALLSPVAFEQSLYIDVAVTFMATAMLLAFMFIGRKRTLTRAKGVFFIFSYLVYFIYLLIKD